GASEEAVKNAYRQKAINNNPDLFNDPVDKRLAMQRMKEIDSAFDEIMNNLRTGGRGNQNEDRDNFYTYIRHLIQDGQYSEAINQLNTYCN
ncbi:MAG: J domain-containing protein, partial [Oscillospiraceae bacterium]